MEKFAYLKSRAYEYFGAHRRKAENGKYYYVFRLLKNDACKVELLGSFSREKASFSKNDQGVWELFLETNIPIEGMSYKYKLFYKDREEYISDPFAIHSEEGEGGASIVGEVLLSDFFCSQNPATNSLNCPINICRIQFDNSERQNYRDLAKKYLTEIKKLNFTHAEIADINIKNCFAPLPNHGTPNDFKAFVETLKRGGIGVILHLSLDFDVDESIYQSFVLSAIMYWFRYFGIDGISLDPKELRGDRETLIREINKTVKNEFPRSLMISEGFAICGNVTSEDGLGFDFMFDRGWTRDILEYINTEQFLRAGNHKKLTFSFGYACSEKFILPITERETQKIFSFEAYGDRGVKDVFALIGFMMTHPGKKMLSFDFIRSEKIRRFITDINALYLSSPELFELDSEENGFKLIGAVPRGDSIIAYKRFDRSSGELLCISNFSDTEINALSIDGVGANIEFEKIFDSSFYRSDFVSTDKDETICSLANGLFEINIKPFSILIFKRKKNL